MRSICNHTSHRLNCYTKRYVIYVKYVQGQSMTSKLSLTDLAAGVNGPHLQMQTMAKIIDGQIFVSHEGPSALSSLRKTLDAPLLPYPGGWHLDQFAFDNAVGVQQEEGNLRTAATATQQEGSSAAGKDVLEPDENWLRIPVHQNRFLPKHYKMLADRQR